MNNSETLAIQAYHEIQSKASSNMWMQGLSAVIGGPITMGVDIAVIGTHYVPMFNNIRGVYGRAALDSSVVVPIVKNIFRYRKGLYVCHTEHVSAEQRL